MHHNKEWIWVRSSETDEPGDCYTEWSESETERQISYSNTYTWDLEKWYWWACFQGSSRDADVETRLADAAGEGEGGRDWQSSVEACTLPYVERRASGELLYDAGNSAWYFVTTERGGIGLEVGGRFKREGTNVYLWLIHVDVWQKSTQHCKALVLQLIVFFFFLMRKEKKMPRAHWSLIMLKGKWRTQAEGI